jgi:hypothetical protein
MGMFDRIQIQGKILPDLDGRILTPDPNELIYQTKDINLDVRGKLDLYTLDLTIALKGPDGSIATHVNGKHFRFYSEHDKNYEFVGEIKNGIFTCLHFCEGN